MLFPLCCVISFSKECFECPSASYNIFILSYIVIAILLSIFRKKPKFTIDFLE